MKPKPPPTTPRPGPPPSQRPAGHVEVEGFKKRSGPETCHVDPWGSPIDDTKINVGSSRPPGPPKTIINAREWAVDEMEVKIFSDRAARIEYWKYEVNAYKHAKTVRIGFLDRWKGISLETKLNEAFETLCSKLESENEAIRMRKRLEQKFNKKG